MLRILLRRLKHRDEIHFSGCTYNGDNTYRSEQILKRRVTMSQIRQAIRKPVRRPGAENYLLTTLLSFALAVSLTRLFLELTGYPQLGNSTIHISHLLWGGLALFVAALLPLVYANQWAYQAGAVLAGFGVGLFIDEVGKFITQNNDYFYPPAAPIIYAFFLICVFVYLRLNRPQPRDPRAELYAVLKLLEEVLDRDLEPHEREDIERRLFFILKNTQQPEMAHLASELLDFINQSHFLVLPETPDFREKLNRQLIHFEARFLPLDRFRYLIAVCLISMGIFSLIASVGSLLLSFSLISPHPPFIKTPDLANAVAESWFVALHLLQFCVSLALLLSSILTIKGDPHTGIGLGFFGLLVYLTIIDLFLFYYYQFSTIIAALVQFATLLALIRYRQRILEMNAPAK